MIILINGLSYESEAGEWLIDVLDRSGVELSKVRYRPQLGPMQTCDTYLVEVNGRIVRACATSVSTEMTVSTVAPAARKVFDRIL
jgi:formate dehydrogenase major subunit